MTDNLEFPGVYDVAISVPQGIQLGYHELEMFFSDMQVPFPLADILACSNHFAEARGLVQPAGTIFIRDRVFYTIRNDPIEVELAEVVSYCEYRPLQIVAEASMTSLVTGATTELSQSELEIYGIFIHQKTMSRKPILKIFTENQEIGNVSFQIKVSSTLIEEETWEDFTLIQIEFDSGIISGVAF